VRKKDLTVVSAQSLEPTSAVLLPQLQNFCIPLVRYPNPVAIWQHKALGLTFSLLAISSGQVPWLLKAC